jgi:hypothetical protein
MEKEGKGCYEESERRSDFIQLLYFCRFHELRCNFRDIVAAKGGAGWRTGSSMGHPPARH